MKHFAILLCFFGSTLVMAQDNPFGMKGVKAESAYHFTSSMTYKMTTTNKKGKGSWMTNQYFFSDKGGMIGIKMLENSEGSKGAGGIDFMVMDIPKARVFTFMESKMMMGIALKSDKLKEAIEKENASIRVSKTSEVKTIMGYACEGYSVKNDHDKSEVIMWVSKDKIDALANLGKEMAKAFPGKGNQSNYFAYNAHPELAKIAREGRGVLGYTSRSDKGDVVDMELVEMNPKINYTFAASDYKSMF